MGSRSTTPGSSASPVNDPKIAVAVELTAIPNGYGGVYAAPIAAQVIKTLLAEQK